MLITEESLMTTIVRTFDDHLRHRDQQGQFQFELYSAQKVFKFRRVQSLIEDLKYGWKKAECVTLSVREYHY